MQFVYGKVITPTTPTCIKYLSARIRTFCCATKLPDLRVTWHGLKAYSPFKLKNFCLISMESGLYRHELLTRIPSSSRILVRRVMRAPGTKKGTQQNSSTCWARRAAAHRGHSVTNRPTNRQTYTPCTSTAQKILCSFSLYSQGRIQN